MPPSAPPSRRADEEGRGRDALLSAPSMDFYYETHGTGAPLVLLHGFNASGKVWAPFIPELARRYRLIVPDLRGHGRSTNPAGTFTHRPSALDVFALLDRLGIGKFRAMGIRSRGNELSSTWRPPSRRRSTSAGVLSAGRPVLAGPTEGRSLKLGLLADIHERVRPTADGAGPVRGRGGGAGARPRRRFRGGNGGGGNGGAAGPRGGHRRLGEPRLRPLPRSQRLDARSLQRAGAGVRGIAPAATGAGGLPLSHVEPWLDPEDLEQLWRCDDIPGIAEDSARSFATAPQRLLFHGHFHAWRLETPAGLLAWRGEHPVCLAEGRYLVAIAALCDGHCAVLDTETGWLQPFRIG